MGIAIRSKEYLALSLPSIVWKLIIGEVPTSEDLTGIDKPVMQNLDLIVDMDEETFNGAFFEGNLDTNTTTNPNNNLNPNPNLHTRPRNVLRG